MRRRILLLAEHFVTCSLGMQGRMIKERTHLGGLAALRSEVQMLFGAGKIPRETKKFKQERSTLDVLRIIAHFRAYRLDGFVKLARL
jgi:hypothetical protein